MTQFKARLEGFATRLDWQTATETDNKGFHIERSPDGLRWETLGFVAGQGNSSSAISYTFLDEQPIPGRNYYRLLQVDFDGKEAFSPIAQVELSSLPGKLTIYPNPIAAGTDCTVTSTQEIWALRLLDVTGRPVAVFSNPARFSTSALKSGIYWLEAQTVQGTAMEKVVVQ